MIAQEPVSAVPILHRELQRYFSAKWVLSYDQGHCVMVKSGDGSIARRSLRWHEYLRYIFDIAIITAVGS